MLGITFEIGKGTWQESEGTKLPHLFAPMVIRCLRIRFCNFLLHSSSFMKCTTLQFVAIFRFSLVNYFYMTNSHYTVQKRERPFFHYYKAIPLTCGVFGFVPHVIRGERL